MKEIRFRIVLAIIETYALIGFSSKNLFFGWPEFTLRTVRTLVNVKYEVVDKLEIRRMCND